MTDPDPGDGARRMPPFLNRHPFAVPGFFAALVSLIGVADLPTGYYDFLRAVVITAAVALAIISIAAKRAWWIAGSVVVILLWSPGGEVFFHPGKEVFSGLDVLLAAMFIVAAALVPSIERKPREDGTLSPYGSWWFLTIIATAVVLVGVFVALGGSHPGPDN